MMRHNNGCGGSCSGGGAEADFDPRRRRQSALPRRIRAGNPHMMILELTHDDLDDAVYPAAMSESFTPGICLSNLEPGGPGYLPCKRSLPSPRSLDIAKEAALAKWKAKWDFLSVTTSPEP